MYRTEKPAETAKKIRKALKDAFPGVKFSVRTRTYSMGSTVDVEWTDGPSEGRVSDVVRRFKSMSFDGRDDSTDNHGYKGADGVLTYGAHYISTIHNWTAERYAYLLSVGRTLEVEHAHSDRLVASEAERYLEMQEAA